MMGKIVFDDEPDKVPEATYAGINYVDKVSCKEVIRYNEGAGKKKVVLVDCGVKDKYHPLSAETGCGSDPRSLEP